MVYLCLCQKLFQKMSLWSKSRRLSLNSSISSWKNSFLMTVMFKSFKQMWERVAFISYRIYQTDPEYTGKTAGSVVFLNVLISASVPARSWMKIFFNRLICHSCLSPLNAWNTALLSQIFITISHCQVRNYIFMTFFSQLTFVWLWAI